MELWRLWVLRGPNVWAACPVIEAGVDLCAWADQPRRQCAQAVERLRSWLPSLENVEDCANPARVLERLWLHLQILSGHAIRFSSTRAADRTYRYRVAVEYQKEPLGRACLQAAMALWRAAWEDRSYPVTEEIARLRELACEQRLNPSTIALVEAAQARGIPVDHYNPEDGRYLLLGHGCRQRRSIAAETEDVSALACSTAADKHLTEQLLYEAGVPMVADARKSGTLHRMLV